MAGDQARALSVPEAAARVNAALDGLSPEDRGRVLAAAAALYGVGAALRAADVGGGSGVGGSVHEQAGSSGGSSGRPVSLVELMNAKAPATNSQRIALFAYYRENIEGKSTFARGDLAQYFAIAKESKPGNYDRDFASAVKEGWIHEDGDASYLTTTGTKAVNAGFGGKAKPRGISVRRTRGSEP